MRANEFKPDLTVIRRGKSGPERIAVDQDFELQPGDVIEVALRLDDMAGKHKLAQTSGFPAWTEPAAAAAAAGNVAQEATTKGAAANATVTATGRSESAPAPNSATASLEVARRSIAPAEAAAGQKIVVPRATEHELASNTSRAP